MQVFSALFTSQGADSSRVNMIEAVILQDLQFDLSFTTAADYVEELLRFVKNVNGQHFRPVIDDFILVAHILDALQGFSQRSIALGSVLCVFNIFEEDRNRVQLLFTLQQG
jgi:hypothetical protein